MENFEKDLKHKEEMMRLKSDISELRIPTERILRQISSLLESGEVQLIIGDDASGRIPTAIFRKIFDLAYQERGFITPETRFIAGSRHLFGEEKEEKKKKIAEYMERVKNDVEKKFGRPLNKVLIVTDMIKTGNSLDPLIEILNEMGIHSEVVSIGVLFEGDILERLEKRWNSPVYFGMDGIPYIDGNQKISGVVKEEGDLFSETYKNKWGITDMGERKDVQEQINKSREFSDRIALDAYSRWKKIH